MHDGNPPSHPELLQELARQFTANNFDVKFLIRAICNSKTYQRTSKPNDKDDSGANLFAHMAIKVNSPEQLYDSLVAVVGEPGKQAPRPRQAANQANNRPGPNARTAFVNFFLNEDGSDPTQYQSGIPRRGRPRRIAQDFAHASASHRAALLGHAVPPSNACGKPTPRQLRAHPWWRAPQGLPRCSLGSIEL